MTASKRTVTARPPRPLHKVCTFPPQHIYIKTLINVSPRACLSRLRQPCSSSAPSAPPRLARRPLAPWPVPPCVSCACAPSRCVRGQREWVPLPARDPARLAPVAGPGRRGERAIAHSWRPSCMLAAVWSRLAGLRCPGDGGCSYGAAAATRCALLAGANAPRPRRPLHANRTRPWSRRSRRLRRPATAASRASAPLPGTT